MKGIDYLIDEKDLSVSVGDYVVDVNNGYHKVSLYPWEMDKMVAAWITYRRDEEDTDVIESTQFKRLVEAMNDFFRNNPELSDKPTVSTPCKDAGDNDPVVNGDKGNCKSTATPVDLDKVKEALDETIVYYGDMPMDPTILIEHRRTAFFIERFLENYVNAIK